MKILYIGHYRESSGWGDACLAAIRTLQAIPDIDLVCRPIQFGPSRTDITEDIIDCEDKNPRGCDICIQHILPHLMEFNGNFKKCIGYFYGETANTQFSSWPTKLNLMDEVWCPNKEQAWQTRESGVECPISVVPYACNLDKYLQSYEPLHVPQADGTFKFYFIGENIRRKNIPAMIKAFHIEFLPSEPVSLIIKTSMPGYSPEQVHQVMDETCAEIKRSIKLYTSVEDYHSEIIIPFRYTEEEIMRLHTTGDCFVMPSCGESVCIPAFDAMAMGKTPVFNAVGGMTDFLLGEDYKMGGIAVHNYETPVTGMTSSFADIFTGRETWREIDVLDLASKMRQAYEMNDEARERLAYNGLELASQFTYEEVGKKVKELLEK